MPKHKRVLFLFLLGVGLPSIILGYLAFRGIQNDQALLEKQNIERHNLIAKQIISLVDAEISNLESDVLNKIKNKQVVSDSDLIQSLHSIIKQNPLVDEIFYLDNNNKIHIPTATLMYIPDGHKMLHSKISISESLKQKLEAGQQYEFKQKNFQRALSEYLQVYDQSAEKNIRGEILSFIARVQKKSGSIPDAIKTYERISNDFNNIQTATGILLGLTSRLECGALFLKVKDTLNSLRKITGINKSLNNSRWELEKAQFIFFKKRIQELLNEINPDGNSDPQIAAYKDTISALQNEEEELISKTEKLLHFQQNAVAGLKTGFLKDTRTDQHNCSRLKLNIGNFSYLTCLFKSIKNNINRKNTRWGIILDFKHFLNTIIVNSIQQSLPPETDYTLRELDGRILQTSDTLQTGSIIVKSNFKYNFPDWNIELHQQEPELFESFFSSSRSIYFYMFILIAGILIFGLVLSSRIVSHELELAKMKSDFVSTISHEFKSPLTSIRQLAEMLQSGRVPSEDRRQKYYDVLVEQSERLTHLTENVLDFAKMEEGKKQFNFESVDIKDLMDDIVSVTQERVKHYGFELQLLTDESIPLIKADIPSLIQSINNLIDNAIKYSGSSKKVIARGYKENGWIVISVRDFGIGIKKEETDKIFDRFYRGGDELTRNVKGSGLGLTLVKQIIEAHKGTIVVESEPGKGSTFIIKLPVDKLKEKFNGANINH
ncbi:ATP-binding protein [Bacteroidota bacterium]